MDENSFCLQPWINFHIIEPDDEGFPLLYKGGYRGIKEAQIYHFHVFWLMSRIMRTVVKF